MSVNNVGQQMQLDVYGSAVAGKRIELPFSFENGKRAQRQLFRRTRTGTSQEPQAAARQCARNREAFDRVQLIHRTLNDVSVRDISTEILGTRFRLRLCSRRSEFRESCTPTESALPRARQRRREFRSR